MSGFNGPSLVERLRAAERQPTPSVLLIREAADAIERLQRQVAELRRDAREDAQGAAVEATWRERQGEDYESY